VTDPIDKASWGLAYSRKIHGHLA